MVWNVFIAAYNLAGSILLFQKGQFLFFNYPEYQIYGGIGMGVMAICLITTLGMANNSYMFARLCFFLWPILLVIVAVRAALMIFQLSRQQNKIVWECNNGGQLWGTAGEQGTDSGTMPSGLCAAGFHSLYIAFVFSLAIDWALQVYAYFMCWRFKKRIEHYFALATKESNVYGS